MIPLIYEVFRVLQVMETESRMMIARYWGKGRIGSSCLRGTEFQFYKMERVLEMDGGDGSAL